MLRRFYSNPTSALVIILAVMVLGILQFTQLPIALYPQASKPSVTASLSTGSMSATEFKKQFGKRIETTLQGINDVDSVKAEYRNGYAKFEIEFDWGVDPDESKSEVKVGLESIESSFPKNWYGFRVYFTERSSAQVVVSVSSESIPAEELSALAQNSLLPHLERIPGVGRAFVVDFGKKKIDIRVNPDQLVTLGIDLQSVKNKLTSREFDKSLGTLSVEGAGSFQVSAKYRAESIADLKETVVGAVGGFEGRWGHEP